MDVIKELFKVLSYSEKFFKFNNLVFFVENDVEEYEISFDELFWKMCLGFFLNFFEEFWKVESVSFMFIWEVFEEWE